MQAVSRPPNRLLQALPVAEFQSLSPHLATVELTKGAALVEAGAPLQHVYLPHSGIVSMMVSLLDGETVEVATIGRDSLVGAAAALEAGPALTDAIVVVPGIASALKAEDFRAVTDRSSVLRKLLARHEQALLAQVQQSAACNASHSVEARLSRLLLRARDLCDTEGLPLTQELLAQLIGVRRNAVSIVAHAFQQAGLVTYSRGHIEIRDIDGLRRVSCECYAAVRTQCERLLGPTG
ncbi:MAG: Crp/Fnr family transcriptional regulator [Rhizobiales bacterium]|nr:Crp/Fnr family transcriptional regulator [Hyphomicrobiales bacterium]